MISQLAEILETHYIESRRNRRYAIDELGSLCELAVGVRNISRGGAQVACAEAALESIRERSTGRSVAFELLTEPSLAFTAEVVYEKQEDGVHLMGLKFVDMTPEQESVIDGYINTLS